MTGNQVLTDAGRAWPPQATTLTGTRSASAHISS
jgi:hypothetical protein